MRRIRITSFILFFVFLISFAVYTDTNSNLLKADEGVTSSELTVVVKKYVNGLISGTYDAIWDYDIDYRRQFNSETGKLPSTMWEQKRKQMQATWQGTILNDQGRSIRPTNLCKTWQVFLPNAKVEFLETRQNYQSDYYNQSWLSFVRVKYDSPLFSPSLSQPNRRVKEAIVRILVIPGGFVDSNRCEFVPDTIVTWPIQELKPAFATYHLQSTAQGSKVVPETSKGLRVRLGDSCRFSTYHRDKKIVENYANILRNVFDKNGFSYKYSSIVTNAIKEFKNIKPPSSWQPYKVGSKSGYGYNNTDYRLSDPPKLDVVSINQKEETATVQFRLNFFGSSPVCKDVFEILHELYALDTSGKYTFYDNIKVFSLLSLEEVSVSNPDAKNKHIQGNASKASQIYRMKKRYWQEFSVLLWTIDSLLKGQTVSYSKTVEFSWNSLNGWVATKSWIPKLPTTSARNHDSTKPKTVITNTRQQLESQSSSSSSSSSSYADKSIIHLSNPRVRMETNYGAITMELYLQKAPKTAENFLQYVRDGFYDGTIFHRVIKGFMIQGGGLNANMQKKPTMNPIINEAGSGLKNLRGTVTMARSKNPHSASSQFFINTANNTSLDYKGKNAKGWGYCVFGKVVEGMDVINTIENIHTITKGGYHDVPANPVIIENAIVENDTQQSNYTTSGNNEKSDNSNKVSSSVFAKNNSNVYHKSNCPELGTEGLMEFASSQKARKSGGVPCVNCNP